MDELRRQAENNGATQNYNGSRRTLHGEIPKEGGGGVIKAGKKGSQGRNLPAEKRLSCRSWRLGGVAAFAVVLRQAERQRHTWPSLSHLCLLLATPNRKPIDK